MRRRRSGSRRYSLVYLLSRQPKTLARHPHYEAMLASLRASERLRAVRLSRRAYTLLNNARIAPENLHHFYRTYRLPANSFFPLFFEIKRTYLADRQRRAEARRRAIREIVHSLPDHTREEIKYLGYLERSINAAGESPVWQKELYPPSKKRANEYLTYDRRRWLRVYREHLASLSTRYRRFGDHDAQVVLACLTLELKPSIPPVRPDHRVVAAAYRRLSLVHHPDRGGDGAMFISLKAARDALLNPEH